VIYCGSTGYEFGQLGYKLNQSERKADQLNESDSIIEYDSQLPSID